MFQTVNSHKSLRVFVRSEEMQENFYSVNNFEQLNKINHSFRRVIKSKCNNVEIQADSCYSQDLSRSLYYKNDRMLRVENIEWSFRKFFSFDSLTIIVIFICLTFISFRFLCLLYLHRRVFHVRYCKNSERSLSKDNFLLFSHRLDMCSRSNVSEGSHRHFLYLI